MIELEKSLKGMIDSNVVAVSFPEVHPNAVLLVDFHRTLRTPEDGRIYRCPHTGNGLTLCDAKHLKRLASNWNKPNCFFHHLLQSEAVRIRFCSPNGYPFAVKIIVNGRCAITGNPVAEEDPSGFLPDSEVQNYLAVTDRTILDGCLDAGGVFHQIIPRMLEDSVTLGEPKDYLSDSTHINIQVVPLRGDAEAAVAKRPLVFKICESVNLSEPAFESAGSARADTPQYAVRSDSLSLDEYDFSACEKFAVSLLNTHEWSHLEREKPWIKPMPVDYFDTLGNHWSYGCSEWGFESRRLPLSRPPAPVSGNDTLVILRDSDDHIAVTRQLLAELHPEDVIFYRNPGRMGEESTYRFGLEDGTFLFTDYGWDGSYKTECSGQDVLSWMPKSCKDQTEDFYLGFGMAIHARKDWLTTPVGRVLYQQVLKTDEPEIRSMDVYSDLAYRYTRIRKLIDQFSSCRKIVLTFPEVDKNAVLEIECLRTLRVSEIDEDHCTPPAFDAAIAVPADLFRKDLPPGWRDETDYLLPLYQSEAVRFRFKSPAGFAFAVRIRSGNLCSMTDAPWIPGLSQGFTVDMDGRKSSLQNYLLVAGEEQGADFHSVRQFRVPDARTVDSYDASNLEIHVCPLAVAHWKADRNGIPASKDSDGRPSFDIGCFDLKHSSKINVRLLDPERWLDVTGCPMPGMPFTADDYAEAGLSRDPEWRDAESYIENISRKQHTDFVLKKSAVQTKLDELTGGKDFTRALQEAGEKYYDTTAEGGYFPVCFTLKTDPKTTDVTADTIDAVLDVPADAVIKREDELMWFDAQKVAPARSDLLEIELKDDWRVTGQCDDGRYLADDIKYDHERDEVNSSDVVRFAYRFKR